MKQRDFFILDTCTESSINGVYPQGVCTDRDEKTLYISLEVGCILTDILSVLNVDGVVEIVLSQKAYNLLVVFFPSNSEVRKVKFNPAQSTNYFAVKFNMGIEDYIDFKNSRFEIRKGHRLLSNTECTDVQNFISTKHELFVGDYKEFPFMSDLICSEVSFIDGFKLNKITRFLFSTDLAFYTKGGLLVGGEIKLLVEDNLVGFEFFKVNSVRGRGVV